MIKKILAVVFAGLFALACAKQQLGDMESADASKNGKPLTKSCTATDPGVGSDGAAAYGSDFASWLNNNGYSALASTEGWGGKQYSSDCAAYWEPVIFIHGNADYAQGWSDIRDDFITYGYYPSEVYAIGYGLKGTLNASYNHHKAEYMQRIRSFITAVKAYTGKSKVDVIAHSLGVTLSRKAIKGGNAYNTADRSGAAVALGSSMQSSVDTFVGIAGGNRGLLSCGWYPNNMPADTCRANGLSVDNPFINDLGWGGDEGSYTYAIYSWVDEVVCSTGTCYVWYSHSSYISGQDGSSQYYSVPYGHFGVRNYTASTQIDMVLNHTY
ncbi:MAG: hypothetical protein A2Y41_10835 [Spirochaetes bacterium GWB1_36_13]|nr:MAG: hypothetical protein A2Y41_10835 [Spirochaetes bacterium GWB1_36_13]